MLFKDIPKLYSHYPMYSVDAPLCELPRIIDRHIQEHGLILNPDFQRGHVWTSDQQRRFVEFVLRGGKSGLDLYFNHPGWMRDWKGEFVCVDGLQRITAFLDFFDNKVPIYGGHYYQDFEDKLPWTMTMKVNINNLQTKREVLEWYLELNSGGTPHSDDELGKVRSILQSLE